MTPYYDHGGITIYHGDCRGILPGLEPDSVTLLWTDPPYGHGNHDGDLQAARVGVKGARQRASEPIANDGPETMREAVDATLRLAVPLLRRDCCCCCCCCGGGGPSPTFAWVASRMDTGGLSFFHSVIWDKRNPGIGFRYRRQHEMVMVAHRRGGRLAWSGACDALPNIIQTSKSRDQHHPNEKPLTLVTRFVLAHASPGDIVLDPFMGSGTTGVACIRTGRRFIGIEKEPKYFTIACQRIEAELARHPLIEPAKPVQKQLL